jgi:hypothetical protein
MFNDNSSSNTPPQEIKNIIKKLKNGKASGGDGDSNILTSQEHSTQGNGFLDILIQFLLKTVLFSKRVEARSDYYNP